MWQARIISFSAHSIVTFLQLPDRAAYYTQLTNPNPSFFSNLLTFSCQVLPLRCSAVTGASSVWGGGVHHSAILTWDLVGLPDEMHCSQTSCCGLMGDGTEGIRFKCLYEKREELMVNITFLGGRLFSQQRLQKSGRTQGKRLFRNSHNAADQRPKHLLGDRNYGKREGRKKIQASAILTGMNGSYPALHSISVSICQ